jgi:acyl carrier protein
VAGRWAVAGAGAARLVAGLAAAGVEVRAYPDLAGLAAAAGAGEPVPEMVLACAGAGWEGPDGDGVAGYGAGDAAGAAGRVLGLVQTWLAAEPLGAARLVLLTRGAVACEPGEGVADLPGAAVWGLVRSAQSENPGRLVLADLPVAGNAGAAALRMLAAAGTGEPELAIRAEGVYARRLARPAGGLEPPGDRRPWRPGTVLVTGGTGTLGGLVAGHLAGTGRARAVVLASRSGPAATGAAALAADVAARGARVQVVACDVADRVALAGLLAQVPTASPLTGVVHTAGVVDDGVIETLTPGQVDAVMRPKADAAWHLHELTRDLDLETFILFSSAAAIFGGAGQGSYTAGNAFLDGLAAHRRAAGLPAVSLAWGAWVYQAGIGRNLSENSLVRISRSGIIDLAADEGLALLDLAISRDEPTLIPARLDLAGLRARAAQGADMPPLWHGLIGPVRPAASTAAAPVGAQALRAQLAGLPPAGQLRVLTDLVRAHAAAVLGHASPEALEPGQAFKDVGFDSLTAVELRNRLGMSTGLQLPATLVFDYPTSARLSSYLSEILSPAANGNLDSGSEEDEIRRLLASIPIARLRDSGLLKTLTRLSGSEPSEPVSDEEDEDSINAMDAATLVRMAIDGADI